MFALVIGQNPPLTHELAWNPSLATARFKAQPFLLQDELDLSVCPAVALTVQRRAYCPPSVRKGAGDFQPPSPAAVR
ncbi:MAG TPA: hypothetical protein PKM43_07190 [Verrucomicrobiota bacterium]|nr:hypothetical protein [Verrucomicrobiota bacterium]HRZ56515.1 hypothetical protein [Candidatus Paceibacterota bacterium]